MSIDLIKENSLKLAKERSRRYPTQSITDMDFTDDIALLANSPAKAKSLLHSLEQAAGSIGLHVNIDKTEYMCFNQRGDISTLMGGLLKLVDKFTYLVDSASSTENDAKAWIAIDRLLVIWKSNLTGKIKQFFQSSGHVDTATWMLTKCMEKKLDGNYTRMLRAILNKSWRQHPTKQQLYSHLPSITKTIQIRWTRHVEHCWRSKDKLISNVLQWTPAHGQAKVWCPARTYI